MVEIRIDLGDKEAQELFTEVVKGLLKTNKKEIRDLIRGAIVEALYAAEHPLIIRKAAELYRSIEHEINYQYEKEMKEER